MGAKSEKNRSKIEVKFEIDFGSDFGRHRGIGCAARRNARSRSKSDLGVLADMFSTLPPGKPRAADLIAPRIPPGRVDGLWLGLQFDCLNVDLDGCWDAV